MKAFAATAVLVAVAVGLSVRSGAVAHAASPPWGPTEQSSSLLHHRHLSCTASVTSQVPVGHTVTVRFALHNRSRHAVTIQAWVGNVGFTADSPDGTHYDSNGYLQFFISIPPPEPLKLAPGATFHFSEAATVRWAGPLEITPYCFDKHLPPLRVGVLVPWTPPAESSAIDEVVAAAGHLLDNCHPQTPGVPVDGQIDPPSGKAPPMDAQCTISLSGDGRFLQAQVLILIPPGLQGFQIYQPYETVWPNDGPEGMPSPSPPYEAIAWEFVVTGYGAIPVAASTADGTKPSKNRTTSWTWNGKRFVNSGWSSCGFDGYSWGGTGPDFDFISTC